MDEFGSPLAGGIQAVRRNISSSFLGAPRQAQADPVTTSLLQQQSLSITSVSQQLQNISSQIGTLDLNLKGVKENLALSDQLERQREAAKQNRERILAEQGLREGKESALENKIQQSLTQPLQRIGVKTQSSLGSLTKFLFTLAGGWLTVTGIDLLQSISEGNVDKINKLKVRFIGGLTLIAGTLTAITLGIKNTLRILGMFTGNVARVAFGGLLRVGLKGVQVLLAGLVKKAALLGGGFFAGGIGGLISQLGGLFLYDKISKFIGNIFRKKTKIPVPSNIGKTFFNPPFTPTALNNFPITFFPGNLLKSLIIVFLTGFNPILAGFNIAPCVPFLVRTSAVVGKSFFLIGFTTLFCIGCDIFLNILDLLALTLALTFVFLALRLNIVFDTVFAAFFLPAPPAPKILKAITFSTILLINEPIPQLHF